jgi:hypothetical protein
MLVGGASLLPHIINILMLGTSFTIGTASTIGTATVNVSTGTPIPTFSLATTAGCTNYAGHITINSSSGVVSYDGNSGVGSGTLCVVDTDAQAKVTNSPFTQMIGLTGQSVSTGGVCDNPTVPRPANAVGFTTLAYCVDWSTPQGSTNNVTQKGVAQSIDWSNRALWLNCAGASGSAIQWIADTSQTANLCSGILVMTDPSVNKPALRLQITPADGAVIPLIDTMQQGCPSGKCAEVFPTTNAYYEVSLARPSTNFAGTGVGTDIDVFAGWRNFNETGNPALEIDFIESFGTHGNQGCVNYIVAIHNWADSQNGNGIAGVSGWPSPPCVTDTNYHTYSTLIASNRSNLLSACWYFDTTSVKSSCTVGVSTVSAGSFTQEGNAIIAGPGTGHYGADGPVTATATIWVAWLRVWSCAGWNSTPNTLITTTNSCSVSSPPSSPP